MATLTAGNPGGSGTIPASEEGGSAAQRGRRRRILEAATTLASRGGFDAVQMRAVAEQADVALGTLYRYFPSKIHLLVSVLANRFEAAQRGRSRAVTGDTAQDRVTKLLLRQTRSLQSEPNLTEALTRAFMFADASVTAEIDTVGMMLTRMITQAMQGADYVDHEPTEDDIAIARVLSDVWLAALVSWVTGRASATDVDEHISKAVRLILR